MAGCTSGLAVVSAAVAGEYLFEFGGDALDAVGEQSWKNQITENVHEGNLLWGELEFVH